MGTICPNLHPVYPEASLIAEDLRGALSCSRIRAMRESRNPHLNPQSRRHLRAELELRFLRSGVERIITLLEGRPR